MPGSSLRERLRQSLADPAPEPELTGLRSAAIALILVELPASVDALLIVFLVWSFVSALFATNHWGAQRAFAVSFAIRPT